MTGGLKSRIMRPARRHKLVLSCVAGAMVVFLAGLAVILTMTPTYRATAMLAVRAAPGATVSPDTLRLLAHEYAIRIGSSAGLEETAQYFHMGVRDVRSMTEVKTDADATVIRVEVGGPDVLEAVGVANHLAQAGVRQAVNDGEAHVEMISPARPDDAEIGPPRRTYTALLLGVTVTLAIAVWYVLNGRKPESETANPGGREDEESAAGQGPPPEGTTDPGTRAPVRFVGGAAPALGWRFNGRVPGGEGPPVVAGPVAENN